MTDNNMIRGIESILIFSDHPRQLALFYKDIVGLKLTMEMVMGENDDEGFLFQLQEGASFAVLPHSHVHGENQHPERMMVNFEVDNIEKEVARLKEEGVPVIQDIYHIQNYGLIATFEDLDGNYFQFVQIRVVN